MKYIVIVPDGVADYPIEELQGKTPLEYAQTPHMDFLAQNGIVGLVQTIPEGLPAGSDIGNLSALGYDPRQSFSGRAPLEAANLGITLADDEVVFRCNVVTVEDEKMKDYSAGHISTEEAAELIKALNEKLGTPKIKFYPGKSYRHLLVLKTPLATSLAKLQCTPPHDILNQDVHSFLPAGDNNDQILSLMEKARTILADHAINKARIAKGENPANRIWLWGQGQRPQLQSFKEKFGLNGSVISAVDLVNGIGKMAGLHVLSVPHVTGYYDTNYRGKAEYALRSLTDNDFVFIHIEATDEASHNGDLTMKVKCTERIDAEVVKPVLAFAKEHEDVRILILPDHRTPLAKRTHAKEPVCFVMYGKNIKKIGCVSFCEKEAERSKIFFASGEEMMLSFIQKEL